LGQIGFVERMDYTGIGTVTQFSGASLREAKDGRIPISRRVGHWNTMVPSVELASKLAIIGPIAAE
jgi:hypothetical protein